MWQIASAILASYGLVVKNKDRGHPSNRIKNQSLRLLFVCPEIRPYGIESLSPFAFGLLIPE